MKKFLQIDLTLKDLYEIYTTILTETERQKIHVKSSDGEYIPVKEMIMKKDMISCFEVEYCKNENDSNENCILRCGDDHIFRKDGRPLRAKFISDEYVDGLSGDNTIRLKRIFDTERYDENVYDINVPYPHWYSLSESLPIISHNTMYLSNFAAMAIRHGHNVMVFTMEDGDKKWAGRVDQNLMQITREEIKEKGIEIKSKFLQSLRDEFGDLMIESLPTGTGDVNMMRATLDRLAETKDFHPDLIIADYLGIMKPVSEYKNTYEKGKNVAEEFRALGQEYKAATLSAQQFNRGGYDKKKPGVDNTQDSIGIPQTADAIIGITQLDDESENRHVLIPLKSRTINKNKIKPVVVIANTDTQTIVSAESFNGSDLPNRPKELQKEYENNIKEKLKKGPDRKASTSKKILKAMGKNENEEPSGPSKKKNIKISDDQNGNSSELSGFLDDLV